MQATALPNMEILLRLGSRSASGSTYSRETKRCLHRSRTGQKAPNPTPRQGNAVRGCPAGARDADPGGERPGRGRWPRGAVMAAPAVPCPVASGHGAARGAPGSPPPRAPPGWLLCGKAAPSAGRSVGPAAAAGPDRRAPPRLLPAAGPAGRPPGTAVSPSGESSLFSPPGVPTHPRG